MNSNNRFDELVSEINIEALKNQRNRGTLFEHLVKVYLKNEPTYKNLYSDVWLLSEVPNEYGIPKNDTGVDLVAKNAENGKLTAIQAKFYDNKIYKKNIDSFLAELNKNYYEDGIIVYSQEHLSFNADYALKNLSKPVAQIGLPDLRNSQIDWESFHIGVDSSKVKIKPKKKIRDYQVEAIEKTLAHFENNDRGKLIMAPGTGKTFTSLKIAEALSKAEGKETFYVLFLVPSIQLLQQTLIGWNNDTEKSMYSFAVTSDRNASKVKSDESMSAKDIGFPATTNANKLIENFKSINNTPRQLMVVFSTYQSIEVLHEAQQGGFPCFDLIIADEAHRTTGAKAMGEEASVFTKVHDNNIIKSKKRLYQTATPKLYGPNAKAKAEENSILISSMDDEVLYGEEIYRLGFGTAVSRDILTDYKVMVLAVDENIVQKDMQKVLSDPENGLNLDDVSKLIGVWNGLMHRRDAKENRYKRKNNRFEYNLPPMQRAISFIDKIDNSKKVASQFNQVVNEYLADNHQVEQNINVKHVDGTMNALQKKEALDWLSGDFPENETRVLSNVKFLTEGIDVPNLDAVIFLAPKKSQVDIVQAVGRIMRKFKGKDYGYIILPIVIPAGTTAESVLDNNKKYEAVWQILNALRSVDERFSATINKLELNKQKPDNINVTGVGNPPEKREDGNGNSIAKENQSLYGIQGSLALDWEEVENAIYGKIVQKVGDRRYLEDWSEDVAKIASRHIEQIKILIKDNTNVKKAFNSFVKSLRHNINSSIDNDQAIEMLSQHLITKPIFEALFDKYSFVNQNPVSQAMESIVEKISSFGGFNKEQKELESFYESVKIRAQGIDNAEAKQKIIITLYDKFFSTGFKSTAERLGIVFTPIEIVDFIVRSIDEILNIHFGKTMANSGIHILDPFTGTGTFIVRILQYLKSKVDTNEITLADLTRKYTQELHANEILLLSYYIAAINIEATFNEMNSNYEDYIPYEGIVLTDTLESANQVNLTEDDFLRDNDERLRRQQEIPITVILGNPPYSARQTNDNDNNQNIAYPIIDEKIKETYVRFSNTTNNNTLYDPLIRAFRWSTDRIGKKGVIGFVTNNSFIDKQTTSGIRKYFYEEFNYIYVINLKGAIRALSVEEKLKEGGNVFDIQTGVSICLLIKDGSTHHELKYFNIGDRLSKNDKLQKLSKLNSLNDIDWTIIEPNKKYDWINQREEDYEAFISMDPDENGLFRNKSLGVSTNRDIWVYGFSKNNVHINLKTMIGNFNYEIDRLKDIDNKKERISLLNVDPKFISWSGGLRTVFKRGEKLEFKESELNIHIYRPFTKKWLCYDKNIIERPRPFFKNNFGKENKVILVPGTGSRKDFSCLIVDTIPDLNVLDAGAQGFALFYEQSNKKLINISSEISAKFGLSPEDYFYYIYAILHSNDYRKKYANSLKKQLPKIPKVSNKEIFVQIGRKLADLHLNYEKFEALPELKIVIENDNPSYEIKSLRHPTKNRKKDLTQIVFNDDITITGIPEKAYEYIVNGRSAIGWIMDQYKVKLDSASGIIDNPNLYSDNPKYIFNLLLSVINVSIQTMDLINDLPLLEIEE